MPILIDRGRDPVMFDHLLEEPEIADRPFEREKPCREDLAGGIIHGRH